MNTASIKPLTVNGIKQLAKKFSREHNITHTDALNLASRQAGYENFVHANRQLPVANAPAQVSRLHLRALVHPALAQG